MNNMLIPSKIHIGFQKREDTYDGKLSFVVYYDNKGILHQKNSFDRWRDTKISTIDAENVPIDGFVFNKNVGGPRESYGWNPRNEWVRVYDPRGWEFEITVANLMFILQECNCFKGKGVEGKMVYAWENGKVNLIPVDSQLYKHCLNFTENKKKSVNKKDVKVGNIYLTSKMKKVLFLGKHVYYDILDRYNINGKQEKYVFVDLDDAKGEFLNMSTLNSLTEEIGQDQNVGKALERLAKHPDYSPVVRLKEAHVKFEDSMSTSNSFSYVKLNGVLFGGYFFEAYEQKKKLMFHCSQKLTFGIIDGKLEQNTSYCYSDKEIDGDLVKDSIIKLYAIHANGAKISVL